MTIEIVDVPIKNGDFPVRYVSLLEGKSSYLFNPVRFSSKKPSAPSAPGTPTSSTATAAAAAAAAPRRAAGTFHLKGRAAAD